jgi:hypothetical protein
MIIAFITDYAAVDRIINHLKLTRIAKKPPATSVVEQVPIMTARTLG